MSACSAAAAFLLLLLVMAAPALAEQPATFQVEASMVPPQKGLSAAIAGQTFAHATVGLTTNAAGDVLLVIRAPVTSVYMIPRSVVPGLHAGFLKGQEWCTATSPQKLALTKPIGSYTSTAPDNKKRGADLLFQVDGDGHCSVKVTGYGPGLATLNAFVEPDQLAKLADAFQRLPAEAVKAREEGVQKQKIYDSLK